MSKNASKFEERKRKSRARGNARRQNLKGDAFKQLRARQRLASKEYRQKRKLERLSYKQSESSYKSRQSLGKAVKRVIQSLPKDSNKRVTVLNHIASDFNLIPNR